MEVKEIKKLRKSFRAIIKDLISNTSGGMHILCDLPLVISNRLIKEVKKMPQYNNKYKDAWDEFIYGLAHVNVDSYQNPNNDIQMTDLECINKIVKEINQKYFPKWVTK